MPLYLCPSSYVSAVLSLYGSLIDGYRRVPAKKGTKRKLGGEETQRKPKGSERNLEPDCVK